MVERLDYVYKGPANPTFMQLSGAPIKTFSYETNQNNMDSGYKTADQHVNITWFTGKKDNNRFQSPQTSSWEVFGGVLTDFTGTRATSGPKPSPIFGVISVSAYALADPKPTPSNWVAGVPVAAVPEPETYAMLLAGLALMTFIVRQRKSFVDGAA